MSVMDVFWVLVMLAALQPVIRQKLLESSRYRMIASIEKKRRSRVILLVHGQETMRFLGIPLLRHIDVNDSEQVIPAIRMTDDDVPMEMFELMELFPHGQSSVEYLPGRRFRMPPGESRLPRPLSVPGHAR